METSHTLFYYNPPRTVRTIAQYAVQPVCAEEP